MHTSKGKLNLENIFRKESRNSANDLATICDLVSKNIFRKNIFRKNIFRKNIFRKNIFRKNIFRKNISPQKYIPPSTHTHSVKPYSAKIYSVFKSIAHKRIFLAKVTMCSLLSLCVRTIPKNLYSAKIYPTNVMSCKPQG